MVKHMIPGVGRMGKVLSEWKWTMRMWDVGCGMRRWDGLSMSWKVVGTVDICRRRKCRSFPTRVEKPAAEEIRGCL